MRLDRAITNHFREYWPERPYVMPVAVSFALPGAAVGALVGWLLGDAEGGAVIGSLIGLFVGFAWMLIAVATWGRSSRRWEEAQREVFVKPTSHVLHRDAPGESTDLD